MQYMSSSVTKMAARRVVVTGIGLVTPLGIGKKKTWDRLIDGRLGVRCCPPELHGDVPVRIAGLVPEDEFAVKEKEIGARTKSRFQIFAVVAAKEALQDADFTVSSEEAAMRAGVSIGSSIGSAPDFCDLVSLTHAGKTRRVSPFAIPKLLPNMAAGVVSIESGFRGPNFSPATACAAGSHAIADAMRLIRDGYADVMLAGGADACICPPVFAGFYRAGALCKNFNDCPEEASKPFDRDRAGFVMSEGAGVLLLESEEHAKERGAHVYAYVAGAGFSGDAYHVTSPRPDSSGSVCVMRHALADAGLSPSDVTYVNAHATSTHVGDAIENTAFKTVFGSHAQNMLFSSTKGATGHLLGAAGAAEAAFTALSVSESVVPPTANLAAPDHSEGFDLDYVPHSARRAAVDVALSNSFGFGGTNVSLVFTKHPL